MIGDSITHGWENQGKGVWDKYYKDRKAINLGLSGDRTDHVLWRRQNGEVDGTSINKLKEFAGTFSMNKSVEPADVE